MPVKDFDAEHRDERLKADRTFKLGGETFTRKAGVRPEVLFEWEDMAPTVSSAEAMRIIDSTIPKFFADEDGAERYRALRERDDEHPLTVKDLADTLEWLVAETTGRPTSARSPSTGLRAVTKDGTQSTAGSPSPGATATG